MNHKIDVLNREKIIDDLKIIIEKLRENKQGCAFAIDGKWGCGKTFILETLEQQLEVFQNEETADDAYYIFHYNCWEYDYYEEPSIAIVSAMIDKANNNLEGEIKEKFDKFYESSKRILKEIGVQFVKNKIGIDWVKDCEFQGGRVEESQHPMEFDSMYAFKRTLDFARKKIEELASEKTILLVVDELDRCMPTYAIKVLERLHHLFEGINNVIVLLAVDSTQLEHSVEEIYGKGVDVKNYLKKFINFSLNINLGKVHGNIVERYSYYFDHFHCDYDVLDQIIKLVDLSGIRIRTFEKTIEKINLIHQMVCSEKANEVILMFELIWGVISIKIQDQRRSGIDTTFSLEQYFLWLAQIQDQDYVTLKQCLGEPLYIFFEEFKSDAQKYDNIQRAIATAYEKIKDLKRTTWYVIEKVFLNKTSFFIESESEYRNIVDTCREFYNMANIFSGELGIN